MIGKRGLEQITDTGAIAAIVDEVIEKNPSQLADYRGGKDKLFGYFVGQVMKATQGKANPAEVNRLLKQKLARRLNPQSVGSVARYCIAAVEAGAFNILCVADLGREDRAGPAPDARIVAGIDPRLIVQGG